MSLFSHMLKERLNPHLATGAEDVNLPRPVTSSAAFGALSGIPVVPSLGGFDYFARKGPTPNFWAPTSP